MISALTLLAACVVKTPAPLPPASPAPCGLIVTDDDIPSGSATAGALYVEEAAVGRALLTADVAAVARGFFDAGLGCVHVADSHDGAIDPGPLEALGVPLLTPTASEDWTWPFLGPMRAPYAAAALVGFHSNAGVEGFRPHTINDSIRGLHVGGRTAGEVTHLSLGLAGFGVPVMMVSGDMNATAEAVSLLPGVEAVTVRWLDGEGEPAFLDSQRAGAALRAAALRGASQPPALFEPAKPLSIRLETWSAERMADQGAAQAAAFAAFLEEERVNLERHPLGSQVYGSGLLEGGRVDGYGLEWEERSQVAAYVAIAFAAWSLHGQGAGWEKVGEGYRAYREGQYEEALAAYARALEQDPYDVATRCRLAAVHQALDQPDQAAPLLDYALQRLDEVADAPMKAWCLEARAEVALERGELEKTRGAALLLQELADSEGARARAAELLQAAGEPGQNKPRNAEE